MAALVLLTQIPVGLDSVVDGRVPERLALH